LCGNVRVVDSLLMEFPSKSYVCLIRHVHSLHGLSDIYGNYAVI